MKEIYKGKEEKSDPRKKVIIIVDQATRIPDYRESADSNHY
jgi:hypothetical protein